MLRIGGTVYVGDRGVLQKAQVGQTKQKDGVTYRLNNQHRWERAKESPGQMSLFGGPSPTPQQAPLKNRRGQTVEQIDDLHWKVGGQTYVDTTHPLYSNASPSELIGHLQRMASGEVRGITQNNRHLIDPEHVPESDRTFPSQTRTQQHAHFEFSDFVESVLEHGIEEFDESPEKLKAHVKDMISRLGYTPGTAGDKETRQMEAEFMEKWPTMLRQYEQAAS